MERDENEDGKNDRMRMVLHVTNVSAYDINAFHLILIFDYKLNVSKNEELRKMPRMRSNVDSMFNRVNVFWRWKRWPQHRIRFHNRLEN